MMGKAIGLTGKRFGKLVVLERAENDAGRNARWRCRCDCGRVVTVLGSNLRRGTARSCGTWPCRSRLPDAFAPSLQAWRTGALTGRAAARAAGMSYSAWVYHMRRAGAAEAEAEDIPDSTLCWECQKAVLGCSWSRSFTPVEGWAAKPTTVYRQGYAAPLPSYRVLACPLFERG